MYHKMPLYKKYQTKKIKRRMTWKQVPQNNEVPKRTARMKRLAFYLTNSALSSERSVAQTQKEASYDTYPDMDKRVWQCGSITLEMVVVLPLFVSFMVFFLFLFRVFVNDKGFVLNFGYRI